MVADYNTYLEVRLNLRHLEAANIPLSELYSYGKII